MAQANFLPFTAPIQVPGLSRSNSISSTGRLGSSLYGHYHGSSHNLLDSKPSVANLSTRSLSRSATLHTMPSSSSLRPPKPQRSNTTPLPSRPQTPALAPPPLPSRPRTPTMPRRSSSRGPAGSGSGDAHVQHERPSLLRRNSPKHSTPQITSAASNPKPDAHDSTKEAATETTRTTDRAEMLRRVANEVESIEKETDFAARIHLDSVRSEKRKRGNSVNETVFPSSVSSSPLSRSGSLRDRRHLRRGSVDSAFDVADAEGGPRTVQEWERWAEEKVRTRRRFEDNWKTKEDTDFTESLIRETEIREKSKKEKDARREWERQAFLEMERQRAIREEQDRQKTAELEQRRRMRLAELEIQRAIEEERERAAEEARTRARQQERQRQEERRRKDQEELEARLKEEALRQEQLEEEVRRIEEEARRLEAEFLAKEKKRQQANASPQPRRSSQDSEQRSRSQTPGERETRSRSRVPYTSYGRQSSRQPTPDSIRRTLEAALDEDSDDFSIEWERFAEAFKLGSHGSRSNSYRARTNRFQYQSPAVMFKEAWESYEARWSQLCSVHTTTSAQHPGGNSTISTPPPPPQQARLGFSDIPWPVLQQPTRANDMASQLTEGQISSFILSPFHASHGGPSSSPGMDSRARRMRIREALLRWHPDKMARILAAIDDEEERLAVKEGAEMVARHLNSLLGKE